MLRALRLEHTVPSSSPTDAAQPPSSQPAPPRGRGRPRKDAPTPAPGGTRSLTVDADAALPPRLLALARSPVIRGGATAHEGLLGVVGNVGAVMRARALLADVRARSGSVPRDWRVRVMHGGGRGVRKREEDEIEIVVSPKGKGRGGPKNGGASGSGAKGKGGKRKRGEADDEEDEDEGTRDGDDLDHYIAEDVGLLCPSCGGPI